MEKNSNPQDWPQYNVNTLKYVQSHLTIPMSLGSQSALAILRTHSHKLGVEVGSCHHHLIMKICKGCNENRVEDEYPLLLAHSKYIVIHIILDGHDKVSYSNHHQER